MEDNCSCGLVGFHAEECGEPRFFRVAVTLCPVRETRVVFVAGSDWVDRFRPRDVVGDPSLCNRDKERLSV